MIVVYFDHPKFRFFLIIKWMVFSCFSGFVVVWKCKEAGVTEILSLIMVTLLVALGGREVCCLIFLGEGIRSMIRFSHAHLEACSSRISLVLVEILLLICIQLLFPICFHLLSPICIHLLFPICIHLDLLITKLQSWKNQGGRLLKS